MASQNADKASGAGGAGDRAWMRLRSLFVPAVSLASVLTTEQTTDPYAAILQLYTWERDRLLTLSKGTAGAAVTVLTGLIASAVTGKATGGWLVVSAAATLVAALFAWGGFLLTGLHRLAEQYTTALKLLRLGG